MRLIDADAAEKKIGRVIASWNNKQTWLHFVKTVLRDEEFSPTIDAEPVEHGHWGEYETNPLAYSLSGFPCSVCGMHQDDIRGLYYCPNCGARMDGDTHGTD